MSDARTLAHSMLKAQNGNAEAVRQAIASKLERSRQRDTPARHEENERNWAQVLTALDDLATD